MWQGNANGVSENVVRIVSNVLTSKHWVVVVEREVGLVNKIL